jgi:glucosamine--fructose-6-phosphate aminotransferase (isomerizing)
METSPTPDPSLLRREILEQPAAVARLLEREGGRIGALGRAIARRRPAFALIAARGSSDNAARYAQYALGIRCQLSTALAAPSLVTLYRTPTKARGALAIGISQSGRSPDVVETLAAARRAGAFTIAIVNDAASPLARAAHEVIPLHTGPERSIAATKTYTTELAALACLAASIEANKTALARLAAIPNFLARALAGEAAAAEAARGFAATTRAVVLARGIHHATSHEIALKLKELAWIQAEAVSSADFQHGPIALAQSGRLTAIVVNPPGTAAGAELRRLARQLSAAGAEVLLLGPRGARSLAVPRVDEWLSPIVAIAPAQWLAFHAARARGNDPDRPRGLRKVTRTR